MNYQIGICDDDRHFLDTLETSLRKYEKLNLLTLQIFAYPNGEALLADYHQHHFNMLILDMEMPGADGIEVAKELRRFDNNVAILYSTIHDDFSLQAFQVHAENYLVKPFPDEKLFIQLDRIFDRLRLQASFQSLHNTYLSLESKKEMLQLPYDNILYISKRRNTLNIHTPTREYMVYMNVKEIRNRLDSSIFVKINPGQIVNWTKVTYLNDSLIYLDDIELSVSRSYITKLNRRYRQETEQLLRINERKILA